MDTFKVVVSYAGIILAVIATLNSLRGRRIMRASLGRQQFKRSQIVTLHNAQKSARVWFDVITTPLLLAGVAYVFYRHFTTNPNPFSELGRIWFGSLLLLFAVCSLFNQLRPAAVLILGASNVQRLKLQDAILDKIFPFRTVSLIETHAALDRRFAAGHCFRTTRGKWDESVSSFADVVAVIVLDLRDHTGFVATEADIIRRLELGYKTVVLRSQSTTVESPPMSKVIENEEGAIRVTRKCLMEPGYHPSQERPIASWA